MSWQYMREWNGIEWNRIEWCRHVSMGVGDAGVCQVVFGDTVMLITA